MFGAFLQNLRKYFELAIALNFFDPKEYDQIPFVVTPHNIFSYCFFVFFQEQKLGFCDGGI